MNLRISIAVHVMSPSVLYIFIIDYFLLKCSGLGMLGPADLIFKTFRLCEPQTPDLNFKLVTKKYNRTIYVLDIDLETPLQLDDSFYIELKQLVKKEGGYKPGSLYLKDKYCTVLKTMLGASFDIILKTAGRDDCPIPAGTYEIRDFHFDNSKFTVPQVYGEFITKVLVHKDGEVVSCYNVFYDMVPKSKE